jgi:hypothetical protein
LGGAEDCGFRFVHECPVVRSLSQCLLDGLGCALPFFAETNSHLTIRDTPGRLHLLLSPLIASAALIDESTQMEMIAWGRNPSCRQSTSFEIKKCRVDISFIRVETLHLANISEAALSNTTLNVTGQSRTLQKDHFTAEAQRSQRRRRVRIRSLRHLRVLSASAVNRDFSYIPLWKPR